MYILVLVPSWALLLIPSWVLEVSHLGLHAHLVPAGEVVQAVELGMQQLRLQIRAKKCMLIKNAKLYINHISDQFRFGVCYPILIKFGI